MTENTALNRAFKLKITKVYDEYIKFKDNTLRKIENNTEFFNGLTKEIYTNRKTKPELIEKYFKHSLFSCAEEVSHQGNLMKEWHNNCMEYYHFYSKNQQLEIDMYETVKNKANEFIDKIREYFYNYEHGNVPFPKVTYTK